jgi:hypothetical protein
MKEQEIAVTFIRIRPTVMDMVFGLGLVPGPAAGQSPPDNQVLEWNQIFMTGRQVTSVSPRSRSPKPMGIRG